jgi:hypothetical protein
MLIICAVLGISQQLGAQSVEFRNQVPMGFNVGGVAVPHWNGGALTLTTNNSTRTPILHFINVQGGEDPSLALTIPDASSVRVNALAQGSDGRIVAAGLADDSSGKLGGFIALISKDRSSMTTAQVAPFCPYAAQFAPDGTVWSLGIEMINANPNARAINQGHPLIRQFDREGKLIASFVPKNGFPDIDPNALQLDVLSGRFATASGRVGWYATKSGRYFEISSAGILTQYPGIPEGFRVHGLALTDSGATIVSAVLTNSRKDALYSLDKQAKKWVPLSLPGGAENSYPVVFGGSGNLIATEGKDWDHLSFFEVH